MRKLKIQHHFSSSNVKSGPRNIIFKKSHERVVQVEVKFVKFEKQPRPRNSSIVQALCDLDWQVCHSVRVVFKRGCLPVNK